MIPSLYEPFRAWSATGSVFIISDTHFDDADCKYMDPAWITPDEHIVLMKKFVHRNDTLVHLGDVGNMEYLKNLPCRKVLITGNHDRGASYYRSVFDEVYDGPLFISDKILLSHEPILGLPWCMNIHGHDHSGVHIDDMHINLASNVCGYKPLNLGRFIKNGGLSGVTGIHRVTIDDAASRKIERGSIPVDQLKED